MIAAALQIVLATSLAYAQNRTVTATWDRNTDAVTAGYRLYYGTAPGSYQWNVNAGNQVSVPLTLAPGRYYFTVRAYNAAGNLGPASAEATIDLTSSTVVPTAAVQAVYQAPGSARVTWQTTNAVSATLNGASVAVNGSTTVAIGATTTFTLVARSASGATATASATATVPTTTSAPSAPVNMTSSVSGTSVTLRWQRPLSGGAPTTYLLYISTTPWGTNVLKAHSVGNVLSFGATLPRGTYYARVRARNAYGTSTSSNQTTFRIGSSLTSPDQLTVSWLGTRATLNWAHTAADAADEPTDYVLEAGTSPEIADVLEMPVGAATSFEADVPSGSYFVRVRAVNGRGSSDPSNEIVVAAPGTASAPPTLEWSTSGSTVHLAWSPPEQGATPRHYVIEAGSAPGLSDLAAIVVGNVTHFSTEAPPGMYYVRVRAVNEHGAGLPSAEVVVQR